MPATAIFTTAQAYSDAVQACNDAVAITIQTPGADIVKLMTSIRPQVNAIFETRRQKELSPTILGETHLVHRFAAKYIKAEREGRSIDDGFRQQIQEMAARTTPKPAEKSRPPVPNHPAENPAPTTSEGHPPSAQAVPGTVKTASSKPTSRIAPAKATSSTPAPSKVGHSSDAAPHNAPPPKTTTRQVLSHVSPPLRVPANLTKPSVHANKVANAVKRLADLRAAAAPIVNEAATPAPKATKGKGREGVEAAAPTAKDDKGKARQAGGAAAGKKRKRDNERPSQRADKREYRGSGLYYQIPCDACERLEKACEKKADQRLVRKGGTASCLGCARGGKKCERPDHPEMSEQDLVLVDDQGKVVDGKALRKDEDVHMEGSEEEREKDAEPPVPIKKKSRTAVVSDDAREEPRQRKKRPTTPKYIEDTESDVAMETDNTRPAVKIGPPRRSASKARKGKLLPQQAKYRHVSWVNEAQRQDAAIVGQEAQIAVATGSSSSRPTAASATRLPAAPRPVPAATNNATPATRELPGFHTATQLFDPPVAKLPAQDQSLSATTNNAAYAHTTLGRLSRLPIQVPEAHGIRDPKLGPADASLQGVIEKQKEVDRSVYALLCCHKDMSVFVERIQGERYRNLDVMASQEASNTAAHQAANKRLASLEKALGMMSARVGQLEVENAKHTDRYKLLSNEHERATSRIKELERRHDVLCKCITQLNEEFDTLTDEVDKLIDLPAQIQKVEDHLFPAEASHQPQEPLPDSANQQTPHPLPDNTAPVPDADSSATGLGEEMAGGTDPMAIDVDQGGSDEALSEDMDQEAGTQEAASTASALVEAESLQESALQEAAPQDSASQEHDARKTISPPCTASPSQQPTWTASPPVITPPVSNVPSAPAPLIADPASPAAIDITMPPPTSTPIANEEGCGEVPTVAVKQPTPVKEVPTASRPEAALIPPVEGSGLLAPPSRARSHSLKASARSRSGSGTRRSPRFNRLVEEEEEVDFES